MQHDVVANPAPRGRAAFPFLAVLQADITESANRMVAPLVPRSAMPGASGRLMPVVRHDGQDYLLALELMVSVPNRQLSVALGSVERFRADITRALDWLFTGVRHYTVNCSAMIRSDSP